MWYRAFIKYYENAQNKEDEMGGDCSAHGEWRNAYNFLWNDKGKKNLKTPGYMRG
jgi:hypothetical protein